VASVAAIDEAQRRGRELLVISFEEACSAQESTFEGIGYVCECSASTRTVTCKYEESGLELTSAIDESGKVKWTYGCSQFPAGPFCINTTTSTGSFSCLVENASGGMSACRTCEYCDDWLENGLKVDCANVYADAIPRGCDGSVLDFGSENLYGSAVVSGGNGGGSGSGVGNGGPGPSSSGVFHSTASLWLLAGMVATQLV
jgi:hypothetical protein